MAVAGSLENNNFKIPSVFGSSAAYKTAPNDFPSNTPTGSVKASWQDGFPEQTFQPNNAPSGADFNGLFGLLSGLLMNTQMGQLINNYDAAFQTSIGGYPNGAIIWFVPNGNWSNKMLFQSVIDNNTNVPYNTTNNTVGTGWRRIWPSVEFVSGLTNEMSINGWYRRYSDGFIMQGGLTTVPGGDINTIPLFIPYTTIHAGASVGTVDVYRTGDNNTSYEIGAYPCSANGDFATPQLSFSLYLLRVRSFRVSGSSRDPVNFLWTSWGW